MTKRWISISGLGQSKMGKRKHLLEGETCRSEQQRREEFQFHTEEGQDFSVTAAEAHLTTQKSSESRIVDPTNNGMVNHYLRDVDHGSHGNKVCRSSEGHCESGYCSSVTKVTDFILLQALHSPLTISTETLCLSITGEKYTVASRQHFVYYESIKGELKRRLKYEYRCDERLKTKNEESTRLADTGLVKRSVRLSHARRTSGCPTPNSPACSPHRQLRQVFRALFSVCDVSSRIMHPSGAGLRPQHWLAKKNQLKPSIII
jgi:hypothetical protein